MASPSLALAGTDMVKSRTTNDSLEVKERRQLVELSERKAHGSLIQCKGAEPNHCSGRSHELRSLYQKKKKRKTPGLRGTARVGMVG